MSYFLKAGLIATFLLIILAHLYKAEFLPPAEDPSPSYPELPSNPSSITPTNTNPVNHSYQALSMDFFSEVFDQKVFYGGWSSLDRSHSAFDYFDNGNGFMIVEVLEAINYAPTYYKTNAMRTIKDITPNFTIFDTQQSRAGTGLDPTEAWVILIRVYDGEYIDTKSVDIIYKVNTSRQLLYDVNNATVSVSTEFVDLYYKAGGVTTFQKKRCKSNFSLYFLDRRDMTPWQKFSSAKEDVLLQYHAHSDDCNFHILAGALDNQGFASIDEIRFYVALISVLGIIHICGAFKLSGAFRQRTQAFKVSLGSLWVMATMDYYLLILNIVLIFIYSIILVFPCIIYGVLTFVAERRAILKSIQMRSPRNDGSLSDEDCKSCGFYFIGLALLFILELIFILSFRLWILQISALVFVPQIYHNMRKGKQYSPNFYHIMFLGLPRLALVFYVKYYPKNMFRFIPNIFFVEVYTGLIIGQLILLFIQMKYPRFFWSNKEGKQNRLLYEDDVCSICMSHLMHPSTENMSATIKDGLIPIQTACGHYFHMQCIKRWIKNKVDCPICRKNIEDTVEDIECGENSAASL